MKNKKGIFSIVMILFWFSLYAYVPQMTNYAKEMGASYKTIGLIAGAYGFSQTILRIPIGLLSDKLMNRKSFILFGIFCAIISAMAVYLIPSPYTLLVARLLAGVASATWVNFTVLYLSYYDPSDSAKSVGIATSNSKVGQVFAMLIGGYVAINYGIRSIFLISIVMAILSLGLGFFIYEEKAEKKLITNSSGILPIIKDKRILHISFLGCLVQFIIYSTTFGFTPIIASGLGANNLQLGYLSTLYVLPQILFSILSGTVMTKRFGTKNTLLFGFIISIGTCILTPFAPSLMTLYIMQFISGSSNAIIFSLLMAMVISGVESHLMTTTMGFYQASYGVGMIIGPMILGGVGDMFGLTTGFIIVGILGLFSIWSVLKLELY